MTNPCAPEPPAHPYNRGESEFKGQSWRFYFAAKVVRTTNIFSGTRGDGAVIAVAGSCEHAMKPEFSWEQLPLSVVQSQEQLFRSGGQKSYRGHLLASSVLR
jgi:hypothetical protein